MNTKLTKPLSYLIILLTPIFLLGLGLRILLTPLFYNVEYRMPYFPPDSYGFTREDRLHWASYAVDYLLGRPDVRRWNAAFQRTRTQSHARCQRGDQRCATRLVRHCSFVGRVGSLGQVWEMVAGLSSRLEARGLADDRSGHCHRSVWRDCILATLHPFSCVILQRRLMDVPILGYAHPPLSDSVLARCLHLGRRDLRWWRAGIGAGFERKEIPKQDGMKVLVLMTV